MQSAQAPMVERDPRRLGSVVVVKAVVGCAGRPHCTPASGMGRSSYWAGRSFLDNCPHQLNFRQS